MPVTLFHTSETLSATEASRIVNDALDSGRLAGREALRLSSGFRDPSILSVLTQAAFESKRSAKGDVVTVSRNVFIPLTNLCRNRCTYCSYAKPADSPEAHTYSLEEVADVVRGGVATRCTEALLCLGDKPEIAYRSYREWLSERGFRDTSELVLEACKVAFEGGMLPHTNAGILSAEEMTALRPWNASMGLMMETTSQRLRGRGMPHFHAPDKDPAVRLRMHEEAGELKIPFTTGLLLGIGENNEERVETLEAIRDLADRYGHIQEVIVQPFHPKPDTPMRAVAPIRDDEVIGWVAVTRLMMGSEMNVQAPPNLAPEMLERLAQSGLNDWGGVSPITVDFINPEAPWPAIQKLQELTERSGQKLRDRGPVYPDWVLNRTDFFDPRIIDAMPRFATDEGYARRPSDQSKEEAA
ncbi:MAG: 7,8-didemethyl-8-hydroxy-5-deazariboflavin synthase subunit CofG [bacterium TMED88]|nr:7,8-didemethyl-8-hydroxy-5-deazariboflavin synthase subunit CofG [Deltaproteobacteria bacterium]OUV36998.1 MAG: 7,8-didemethyl-8-hydroxy-5-deazariboflavin synthase subunit CofG [bacterium TMED88]